MLQAKQNQFQSLETTGMKRCACVKFMGTSERSCIAGLLSLFVGGMSCTIQANDQILSLRAQSGVVPSSLVALRDWASYERTTELSDGTALHQYVSEVTSKNTKTSAEADIEDMPPPTLRLSFVPRFNCAPIVSVVFSAIEVEEADRKDILAALNQMKFLVDGTRIAYPALTEHSDAQLMAHYDTELRRRNNFRILVEAGATAQVEIETPEGNARVYSYSLSGSKRAISRSLSNCQTHTNN